MCISVTLVKLTSIQSIPQHEGVPNFISKQITRFIDAHDDIGQQFAIDLVISLHIALTTLRLVGRYWLGHYWVLVSWVGYTGPVERFRFHSKE